MDGMRFDRLARVASATPTRRSLAQILAGLSLAGGLGPSLGRPEVAAKKKNKNKKKHCKSGTTLCDGECITATHCCGGCAYCSGLRCCDGRCANCCSGADCESGVCIRGVCLANDEEDCPANLAAFTCEKGGWICADTDTQRPCDDDDDCEFGSVCMTSNVCSTPCAALQE